MSKPTKTAAPVTVTHTEPTVEAPTPTEAAEAAFSTEEYAQFERDQNNAWAEQTRLVANAVHGGSKLADIARRQAATFDAQGIDYGTHKNLSNKLGQQNKAGEVCRALGILSLNAAIDAARPATRGQLDAKAFDAALVELVTLADAEGWDADKRVEALSEVIAELVEDKRVQREAAKAEREAEEAAEAAEAAEREAAAEADVNGVPIPRNAEGVAVLLAHAEAIMAELFARGDSANVEWLTAVEAVHTFAGKYIPDTIDTM